VYSMTFEDQQNLVGPKVFLFQNMAYVASFLSSAQVNKRLHPPPDPPWKVEIEPDMPAFQLFATSIPVGPQKPIRAGGPETPERGEPQPALRRLAPLSAPNPGRPGHWRPANLVR
jgi:hypothetical protein